MKTGGGSLRGVSSAGAGRPAVSGIRLAEAVSTELTVGQVVRGTVQWVSGDGWVGLDLAGRRVAAATDLSLGAGTTYEFTVAERGPPAVLTPTRVLPLPPRAEALRGGWLGPAAEELRRAVAELPAGDDDGAPQIAELIQGLTAGSITGADLTELVSRLGALREFGAMNALWRENVRRGESLVPRVLPLPVEPGGWLRDARLFVLPGEESAASSSGQRSFSVVLLLELAGLGALRVDVELWAAGVHLRFTAERSETVDVVRAGAGALEESLEADGLRVRGITFRHAGPSGLPVSDLVAPPIERGASTVDLHV